MALRQFLLVAVATLGAMASTAALAAPPAGRVTIAWHVTIAPSWFDPSTAPPQITPFGMLYALHDALVRPLSRAEDGPEPGRVVDGEPGRARRTSSSCAAGLKFHNGDPLTTEDVKFSFERYKGAGAKELQERVAQVEIVDPLIVRFHLKEPWPDFMTFYGTTATAAGLVVPEEVPDAGRRRRLPQASDRRRPLQVRQPQARRRGRAGGLPRLLAPRAQRQDAGHEERARGDHARGDAEDRRGRHRRTRSTARTPRTSSATRACSWWPPSTRRSSGSSSPSSGTRSRRGTTSGCGWR